MRIGGFFFFFAFIDFTFKKEIYALMVWDLWCSVHGMNAQWTNNDDDNAIAWRFIALCIIITMQMLMMMMMMTVFNICLIEWVLTWPNAMHSNANIYNIIMHTDNIKHIRYHAIYSVGNLCRQEKVKQLVCI